MSRSGAGTDRLNWRPAGLSAGAVGLALSWAGGAAIARLTGATPVVILLAAGLVWFVAAMLAGVRALRGVRVRELSLPSLATAGDEVPVRVTITTPTQAPLWVSVRHAGSDVASGWTDGGVFDGAAVFATRGRIDALEVRVRSAGATGLVWWSRSGRVSVDELLIAPRPTEGGARVARSSAEFGGDFSGRPGAIAGEIDGVRPWREGDGDKSVHWVSTLRSGELVVHDRRHDEEQRVIVRARSTTADPDAEAGRVRAAMDDALRAGARVLVAVDDGDPASIADSVASARWSALAELGRPATSSTSTRSRLAVLPAEPETTAPASARWWAAGATLVSLLTLNGALEYGPMIALVLTAVTLAAAAVSAPALASGGQIPTPVRVVVGLGALASFLAVAAGVGPLNGLLAMLRGPLPQVLVILVLLHGFECRDRRTVRVGLGISGVVLAYASGLRVDDAIGWWLLAWIVCYGVAMNRVGLPMVARPRQRPMGRRMAPVLAARAGWLALGVAATVAVLAIVPIPEGPARLTLPTLIEDVRRVGEPGAIAGPDGEVRDDGGSDTRAPAGRAGGYTGFAQSMDTSVRGELSDEIVMRVRAPEPDFWRGQTFAEFDGRYWHAEEDAGDLRGGPNIDIPRAMGDTADDSTVEHDRFVQTYYLEADMPNVVFAAYRPVHVVIDADVWTRSDGALRASTTLVDGSIYTVVSARPRVTAEVLRRHGSIGPRLSRFGRQVLSPFLELPESTTPETIALATELAEGQPTTYDIVLAYERWLADNVVYDLDAPVPDEGEDAVHDFLFDSRRGFCEQIASALAIMLRTQGIPTRVATGYAAGTRDRVAGVFEVRASDAHAWVEVWFPQTGWQAFDPTASVPLSGDAERASVGAELVDGAAAYAGEHTGVVLLVMLAVAVVVGIVLLVVELRRRRRRGRWGLLQDEFVQLAARRGAPAGATNTRRAESWTADDDAAVARAVAAQLDRVAFDPTFDDDDEEYEGTRRRVGALRSGRR